MTYKKYLRDAAELRAHMERPIEPFSYSSVLGVKESPYLPGGYERSTVPEVPPGEDLSALNPRPHGKKGGRPRRKR